MLNLFEIKHWSSPHYGCGIVFLRRFEIWTKQYLNVVTNEVERLVGPGFSAELDTTASQSALSTTPLQFHRNRGRRRRNSGDRAYESPRCTRLTCPALKIGCNDANSIGTLSHTNFSVSMDVVGPAAL